MRVKDIKTQVVIRWSVLGRRYVRSFDVPPEYSDLDRLRETVRWGILIRGGCDIEVQFI